MVAFARFFIRLYQRFLSPILHSLGGTGSGCRFDPTCSDYFLQALETHGLFRGTRLGLLRIARCHPWGGFGSDPVPGPDRLLVPAGSQGK